MANMKEKYKSFQWAVYLSKITNVVNANVAQELTQQNINDILMEK